MKNQEPNFLSAKKINHSNKHIIQLSISNKVIKEVLKNLEIFENEKEFLNSNISLINVAKRLYTNTTYLSKVVNHYKHKTFSNYISDLRLDYCIDKLKSEQTFRHYTIDAIAHEIGFNKPQPFSKAFFKKTGKYPSSYIKQLCESNTTF